MLLQFDLSTQKLLDIVKIQLNSLDTCYTDLIPVTSGDATLDALVLDHVVFQDATIESRAVDGRTILINVPSPFGLLPPMSLPYTDLQITQKVMLYFAELSYLEGKNLDPITDAEFSTGDLNTHNNRFALSFDLFLDIDLAVTAASAPALTISFDKIQLSNPVIGALLETNKPGLLAQINTALKARIATVTAALPLDALDSLAGGSLTVVNAGITLTADDSSKARVAIRLEIQDANWKDAFAIFAAWKTFYEGKIAEGILIKQTERPTLFPPGLTGQSTIFGPGGSSKTVTTEIDPTTTDWNLYVDQGLITRAATRIIAPHLQSTGGDFHVDPGVETWWEANRGIDVHFSGTDINACSCFGFEVDLDLTIDLHGVFSLPKPDRIRIDFSLDYTGNHWKEFCCEVTAALVFPIVAPYLLATGKIDWGGLFLGLAAAPLSSFAVMVAMFSDLYKYFPIPGSTDNLTVQRIDDSHFYVEADVNLNTASTLGGIQLTRLETLAAGLLFGGSLSLAIITRPPLTVSPITPFRWTWYNVCADNPERLATASVTTSDVLDLCAVSVRDNVHLAFAQDQDNQFAPYLSVRAIKSTLSGEVFGYTITIAVPASALQPAYLTAPYPVKLLIQTTGGARLLTIPALHREPARDFEAALKQLPDDRLHLCAPLTSLGPLEPNSGWYQLQWPDPIGINNPLGSIDDAMRLYRVVLSGLTAGETIAVQDMQARNLMTADVSASGHACISAFVPPVTSGANLHIRRKPAAGSKAAFLPLREDQVQIFPTLFSRLATLPLSVPATGLCAFQPGGQDQIALVSRYGLSLYAADDPARLRLLRQVQHPGLSGVITWNYGLLAWGEAGFASFDPTGGARTLSEEACALKPVRALACSQGLCYVLTPVAVTVLDANLHKVGEIPVQGGRHMTIVGSTLIISTGVGLLSFTLGNPHAPAQTGAHPMQGVTSLAPSQGIDLRACLYVGLETGGILLDLTNPPQRATPADHSQAPAFQVVARFTQPPWFVGAVMSDDLVLSLAPSGATLTLYRPQSVPMTANPARTP